MKSTMRAVMQAPRFASLPSLIRELAWMLNLELKIEVDKHFITENVRFSVTGEDPVIDMFSRKLHESIAEYNGR